MSLRALLSAVVTALVVSASPGVASTIEFDDSDQLDFFDGLLDDGDLAVSEDGSLVISFSNIVTSDGIPGAQIDEDGIYLGRDPIDFAVVSLDLVFSADVRLTAYDIDSASFADDATIATFAITGPDGRSGNIGSTGSMDLTQAPSGPVRQPFDMGTISFFAAGETYSLSHSVFGTDVTQIDEFDFELVLPIPLPAGIVLLGAGLAALGSLSLSRRKRKA